MSSFSSDSALCWLTWLQNSQSAVDILSADNYSLYELMHERASCLAPVDACYFCFYRAADQTLFFVYNFDGEHYDEPLTLALGEGPTSWVVHHGQPFVLSEDTESIQHGNVQFGHYDRSSNSALHLPIGVRERGATAGTRYSEILGVFSIQSYQKGVYNRETVAALQLLCDHVARHLQRKNERAILERSHNALSDKFKEHEAYKIRIANHFVELMQPLSRQIQTLSQRLSQKTPPATSELRGHFVDLNRLCSRLQSQVNQLPMDNRPFPASVADVASVHQPDNPLHVLSDRELEVLRLMATGSSNEQIANALSCSIHTAKKHCANIYSQIEN